MKVGRPARRSLQAACGAKRAPFVVSHATPSTTSFFHRPLPLPACQCFFVFHDVSNLAGSVAQFGPNWFDEHGNAKMASRYRDDSNRSRSASPPFQDTPTTLLSQSQHLPPTPGRKVTCPHSQLLYRKPRRYHAVQVKREKKEKKNDPQTDGEQTPDGRWCSASSRERSTGTSPCQSSSTRCSPQ